ncbi:hypothetical protein DITRI_Ditri07aG0002600 [Diplodiscus trichospermus]
MDYDSSKYGAFDGMPKAKEVKSEYGSKPREEEKPNYSAKSGIVYNPKAEEKPGIYEPKPEERKKDGHEKKPYVVKPKPEGQESPNCDTKQEEKSGYEKKKKRSLLTNENNIITTQSQKREKPASIRRKTNAIYVVKSKPDYGTKREENEN